MPGDGDDPRVGRALAGRYRILRRISAGTMSTVYVAEQQLGTATRHVAVKVLPPGQRDADLDARFQRECALVVSLHHPNTIRFYDYGELGDGTLYIVMEYVEGETLRAVVERGPLPFDRVRTIVGQIVGSLGEAHARGIVHRDLKPENVLVAPHGHTRDFVKVVDFGIAKPARPAFGEVAEITVPGTLLGTPTYMSPEQFIGSDVDARTDVYALGVLTYELLTGTPPFVAATPMEWAMRHLHAPPRPFEETAPGNRLPKSVKRAVMHALAKNRSHRPASVEEFYEELVGAREQLTRSKSLRRAVLPGDDGARYRLPERSLPATAFATAMVLAAATLVGWLTWAWGTDSGPFAEEPATAEAPVAAPTTEPEASAKP